MKIGIFDSGLGGLWVLRKLREAYPAYDYAFFGDQANVPYGNKTIEELMVCTQKALKHLYQDQNCQVVMLACNTTSSTIYGDLQAWVEQEFPGRVLLDIVSPTVDFVKDKGSIVFFGTRRTVMSHAYRDALPGSAVHEVAMPELATMIEDGDDTLKYISLFKDLIPADVSTGALVCTHYGIKLDDFKNTFTNISEWVAQEDIVPKYFESYFSQHPDLVSKLNKNGTLEVAISADSAVFRKFLNEWFGSTEPSVINV